MRSHARSLEFRGGIRIPVTVSLESTGAISWDAFF